MAEIAAKVVTVSSRRGIAHVINTSSRKKNLQNHRIFKHAELKGEKNPYTSSHEASANINCNEWVKTAVIKQLNQPRNQL